MAQCTIVKNVLVDDSFWMITIEQVCVNAYLPDYLYNLFNFNHCFLFFLPTTNNNDHYFDTLSIIPLQPTITF